MKAFRSMLTAALLGIWSTAVLAETRNASFDVRIMLNTQVAPGICINGALSDAVGAIVKVVCNTSQFVSIEPTAHRPFLGTIGSIGLTSIPANTSPASASVAGSTPAFAPAASGVVAMAASSASTELTAGGAQRLAEVAYENRATGDRIEAPQQSTPRTSSASVYQNLYEGGGTETTRRVEALEAQKAPIEMLINF
jgi:hypothetical protein